MQCLDKVKCADAKANLKLNAVRKITDEDYFYFKELDEVKLNRDAMFTKEYTASRFQVLQKSRVDPGY